MRCSLLYRIEGWLPGRFWQAALSGLTEYFSGITLRKTLCQTAQLNLLEKITLLFYPLFPKKASISSGALCKGVAAATYEQEQSDK